MPDNETIPQPPAFDEAAARARLTAKNKYTPEQIDTYVQAKKTRPEIFDKTGGTSQPAGGTDFAAANFGGELKTQSPNTSMIGDFAKSFYNGVVPELLKGVSDLPKLVLDASDNKSKAYDHINKIANEGIDKYLTFDIPQENQGGILDSPRSFLNGIGGMLGTVAGTAGLALIGDEPGALAEATNLGAKIKNLSVFSTYMLDPIYQSGKRAGLSDANNARMTLALAPAVASASLLSELWGPGLANRLMGKEIANGVTDGIESELKGLATGEVTQETFKTAAKGASDKMISNMQKLVNSPMLIEAAKAGGAGYLMGAIQQGGEQLYDTMFADKEAQVGAGKYGTDIFSKESFKSDFGNALLGGLLGGAMGKFHASPIVDESIYGYLDGSVQKGEAEGKKATDKLNTVVDNLVKTQSISPDDAKVIKDKIGKINATATTFAKLDKVGTPIDAETRYEAYNLQNNVKQEIIDKGIRPYEATKADHDRMELQLQAEKDGANLDPSINPAAVGKMGEILKNSEPEYKSAQDKVAAIDGYLNELGRTGKRGDISKILTDIDEKYAPKEPVEEKAAQSEPEASLPDTEVAGKDAQSHYDKLSPEDVIKQHGIVSGEIDGLQKQLSDHEAEKQSSPEEMHPEIDADIAAISDKLKAKQADLDYLDKLAQDKKIEPQNKNQNNEEPKTNGDTSKGEGNANAQRKEINANDGQSDAAIRNGAVNDGQQERRKLDSQKLIPEESKIGLRERLKQAVTDDFDGLIDKMVSDGKIKEVPCR